MLYAAPMPASSPLWVFAHQALSRHFHEDPARFVATLDGNAAPRYIEQLWRWALSRAGRDTPQHPSFKYVIDRPRPGLAVVWMEFSDVTQSGEPWRIAFFVRDPDPGKANGYTRMFLLEHDEYASQRGGQPCALACESGSDGTHHHLGAILAPHDENGFYEVIVAVLKQGAR